MWCYALHLDGISATSGFMLSSVGHIFIEVDWRSDSADVYNGFADAQALVKMNTTEFVPSHLCLIVSTGLFGVFDPLGCLGCMGYLTILFYHRFLVTYHSLLRSLKHMDDQYFC